MKNFNAKELIALMLCGTVCLAVIIRVLSFSLAGISTIPEYASEEVQELITYMLGIASGLVLGKVMSKDEPSS